MRLIPLILAGQNIAKVEVRSSVFRIEFDGLAKANDGLIQLPLILQGGAEAAESDSLFGLEFDGSCGNMRRPHPASVGLAMRGRG